MSKFKYHIPLVALLFFVLVLNACRKQNFYTGNNTVLQFETDTLSFDTVFTERATVTRFLKVKNPLNSSILLENIKVKNTQQLNTFKINVDGISGVQFKAIEIPAKDFIYIFVEATIDPNNQQNPFVIVDEIEYSYNGTKQSSYLTAWGQNAIYHKGEILRNETVTWTNELPHVIVRSNTFPGIGVDSFSVLNIEPGCRIYVGQGAGIFVDGKLNIGTAGVQDSITIQSDRIETLQNNTNFINKPGLWQGIALLSGSQGTFHNVVINQAIWGIQGRHYSESIQTMLGNGGRPKIVLDKVQIKNSAQNALLVINSDVEATNSLFYNSGNNTIGVALGGKIKMNNCTIHNKGVASSDASASLVLSNYIQTNTGTGVNDLESADFINCIIYGSLEEQLAFSKDEQVNFNYNFEHCALKSERQAENNFTNCIFNQNPLFSDPNFGEFNLQENSPCIGAGKNNGITDDLYFNPRNTLDIGAVAYF